MKLSAGFEPAPASAPVLAPAPTPDRFQAFQAKSSLLIESWKFKTCVLLFQNVVLIFSWRIPKRCFGFSINFLRPNKI